MFAQGHTAFQPVLWLYSRNNITHVSCCARFFHESRNIRHCLRNGKKLRKGTHVDRYIKRISYHSEYLNRLIRIHKGHYILINSDTDSLDYKLALISALCFCTGRNKGLFELKIKAWEKEKSEQTLQF